VKIRLYYALEALGVGICVSAFGAGLHVGDLLSRPASILPPLR
jgi:hypothetical protein